MDNYKPSIQMPGWVLALNQIDKIVKSDPPKAAILLERLAEEYSEVPVVNTACAFYLINQLGNRSAAEIYLKRAVSLAPNDPIYLGNYAVFLMYSLGKESESECLFMKALEADEENLFNLSNYAVFLSNIKDDYFRAEQLFLKIESKHPDDANNLGNYAVFLMNMTNKHQEAEEYFQKAIEKEPSHENNISDYAVFLFRFKGDRNMAEMYFKKALDLNPKNENVLVNYASFLFILNKIEEGKKVLEVVLKELHPNSAYSVQFEVSYYILVYYDEKELFCKHLTLIKNQLDRGSRDKHWDYSPHWKRSFQINDPNAKWLEVLALVINGRKDERELLGWPLWLEIT